MQSKFSFASIVGVLFFSSLFGIGLSSCGNDKIISNASDAISQRDYKSALKEILSLNDKSILDSDTLLQLSSNSN